MNFIQCFDVETKNKLLINGFKMLSCNKDYNIFTFSNNVKSFNFDNMKISFTNKLSF